MLLPWRGRRCSLAATIGIAASFLIAMASCAVGGDQAGSQQPKGNPGPMITSSSPLPNGQVGALYRFTFSATGGVAPYTWLIFSRAAGTQGLAAHVSDSSRPVQTAKAPFRQTIASAALVVSTSSLAQGTVGVAYSSGQLPSGLSLGGATGEISGTPSTAGKFTFTISVTDSSSPPASTAATFTVSVANWPSLDEYGGLASALAPGGATGYFHVIKDGSRWVLVDPLGNLFWMFSSYVVDTGDGGSTYSTAIQNKYGSIGTWAAQATARLQWWGFNTIGPDSGEGSHNVLPVSTYNAPANPHPMPFLRAIQIGDWCYRSSTYETKNIYNGLDQSVSSLSGGIARDFPDVYDSNWVSCASYFGANGDGSLTPALTDSNPWMIGTWISDADYLYGFGRGPNTPPGGQAHPHLGWITAVTSPIQIIGPGGDEGLKFVYSDTTVHLKAQLESSLQAEYGTISALNSAWGSNYTTFGSTGTQISNESVGAGNGATTSFSHTLASLTPSKCSIEIFVAGTAVGGDNCNGAIWGPNGLSGSITYSTGALSVTFTVPPASGATITVNYVQNGFGIGTGFLDENGSHSWMGNGNSYDGITGANANVVTNLNNFLLKLSQQFFSVAVNACKTAYPDHLVFGPGSLNTGTYSQVLQAAGQYLDVLEIWVEPQYAAATVADAYNTSGKPVIVWTDLQAQPDSNTTSYWGTISSTCNISSTGTQTDYAYTTQDLRGQCYQQLIDAYWNAKGTDGTYPVLGINWWEFVDKVVGGENDNFGLVNVYDNAYDGVEDQIVKSVDPWGYPVGGQTANYGNFLGYVQQEYVKIMGKLAGTF